MTTSKLYEKFSTDYPNATDLISWFINGYKECDNYLYQTYGKTHYIELSELALEYEYNYMDSMVEIENGVRDIVGLNDY